jgi:hypothetical protein
MLLFPRKSFSELLQEFRRMGIWPVNRNIYLDVGFAATED